MKNVIGHTIELRLTSEGKLPDIIACVECFGDMRRNLFRNGAVYKCRECGAKTTLDPEDLKRLKLS